MQGAEMNEYEAERARRIERNRQKLSDLGIATIKAQVFASVENQVASMPRPKKNAIRPKMSTDASDEALRKSRRQRGEVLDASTLSLDDGVVHEDLAAEEGKLSKKERSRRLAAQILKEGKTVDVPFYLASIDTTVHELGTIYRGPFSHRYWSRGGCLYHHPYPVGYKARKVQFGREYEMRIEQGEYAPIFRVTDVVSGQTFEGLSPTHPWTAVCLAKKLGTRISGPLFFGFSDPLTQSALAAQYTPRERAAALDGTVPLSLNPSPRELVAREFSSVEGIGDGAAIALATTRALGPRAPPGSLAELEAIAKEDNGTRLLKFLLESEEVPKTTRLWPKWRKTVVPRLLKRLLGEHPVEDPADGGAPVKKGKENQSLRDDASLRDDTKRQAASKVIPGHHGGSPVCANAGTPRAAATPFRPLAPLGSKKGRSFQVEFLERH
ncbi:hypothetical protein CYMTET_22446, partial [Cymbomonas tetramitiformis]